MKLKRRLKKMNKEKKNKVIIETTGSILLILWCLFCCFGLGGCISYRTKDASKTLKDGTVETVKEFELKILQPDWSDGKKISVSGVGL